MGEAIRMNVAYRGEENAHFVFIATQGPSYDRADAVEKAKAIVSMLEQNCSGQIMDEIEKIITSSHHRVGKNKHDYYEAYEKFLVQRDNTSVKQGSYRR